MIVGIPMLDVPLPVIAGLLLGSAGQFEILESTRRILRKLDFINKREKTIGIRSKYKKKHMHALLKSLKCNKAINRFSMLSKHVSRICVPEKLLFSKNFPPNINPEIPVDVEKVLKFCNVKTEVKFVEAVPFWKQRTARKIREGAYGEVYSFRNVDGMRRILKCIPISGQHPTNSYRNISLEMAVPDIISSKLLSDLNEGSIYVAPNFPTIYSINLVRDRFPEILMKAWWDYKNSFDRLKDPAEHPQPDQYPEQQLFLTIESSYCGEPLTRNILQNAWLGVSIMSQIVSALAVAEAAYNFEHRDLHLENILVQNTKAVSLKYTIHNKHFSVQTIGYQIFIIDFTLSRIYNDKNVYCIDLDEIVRKNCETTEPFYNIWFDHMNMYKIMAEYSKSQWHKYMPVTNIIWLKHVNENILNYLEDNNPHFTKIVPPPEEQDQMKAIRLLRKWNDRILEHKSALDLLQNLILQDNPITFVHQ